MEQALSLSRSLFAWVAAGQEETLPSWEGRNYWEREQIGFFLLMMIQGLLFFSSFVIALCIGVWFGRFTNFFSFSSTVTIILIAREINRWKLCSLSQTMDLLAGMQCALVCSLAVTLHVAWGGVEAGRDNHAFLISTVGPLILLQVAGTFCPNVRNTRSTTSTRKRNICRRRSSNSSVTSEENGCAASDDESTGCREKSVEAATARFSGRIAPMRWATTIRAASAVFLALIDPILVPIPATVRKPWLSGVWTVWSQLCVLFIHVKSTQVRPIPLAHFAYEAA
jgi:hypothetical protein